MTVVSKISAFPKTVEPGVPRLGAKPTGWVRAPLRKYLHEERRPVELRDDESYQLVTAKRARGGVVARETLCGRDISVKTQFRLRAGDFLISKRQIVHGACGLVPPELDGAIVSNEYAVLRGSPEIDLRFLNYLAHSTYFQQTCFHSSIGVHVEKMIFKLDRWLDWNFYFPPLNEQFRIAEVLSTWDRALQSVDAILANTELEQRALMRELFSGERRFKGFTGKFRRLRFRDIAEVDKAVLASSTSPDYTFRYISLSDVEPGRISDELPVYRFSDAPSRARRRVATGDVLMATVRPNLRGFVRIQKQHADCIASTGFAVLSPRSGFDGGYLYHYLFSPQIAAQINALVVGSNYPAINSSDVEGLSIDCPSLDEQLKISRVLDDAEKTLNNLHRQLALLNEERRALLQQLLGGARRVKLAEVAA